MTTRPPQIALGCNLSHEQMAPILFKRDGVGYFDRMVQIRVQPKSAETAPPLGIEISNDPRESE